MTHAQLDRIEALYAQLGRSWHVDDREAMCAAIDESAARSLIMELEQRLAGDVR